MSQAVDQVESALKAGFHDYWSMFYMTGESESTSHEWARSQMIEVSEALFWIAFEKPKKISSVDRFFISEWLSRIRGGRGYYESKEDLLLQLAFGCLWDTDRICSALKLSKSAYYFRLFLAIVQRSEKFKSSLGHLSSECAHFDLRIAQYVLGDKSLEAQKHADSCRRCAELRDFAFDLKVQVGKNWVCKAPEDVIQEALSPFEFAKNNPIKRTFWKKMPPWLRTTIVVGTVVVLGYLAFKIK